MFLYHLNKNSEPSAGIELATLGIRDKRTTHCSIDESFFTHKYKHEIEIAVMETLKLSRQDIHTVCV